MRILHVVPTYLPATRYGGPIHAVHGLARRLVDLGHEVSVFTTSVDGPADSDVPHGRGVLLDGVRVWYFRCERFRRVYYAPAMQRELSAAVRGFDLVHLHSVFLWPTSMAARLAHAAAVPYVVSPRGMLVRELIARRSAVAKASWLGLVERTTLGQAAAIHLTSDRELDDARALPVPLPAPFVVENGVDRPPTGFQDRCSVRVRELAAAGPYALYLGRIHPKKGLARAIEALATTPIRLVLCGPDDEGHTAELERAAHRAGVTSQLRFEAPVHGDDKWALLSGARFVILPSDNENFGNTVLEAMAVERPVVVTEHVGAARIVREAEAGLVCPAEAHALRAAALSLWDNPALGDAYGKAGKRCVEQRYGWREVAARMADAYAGIAALARVRGYDPPMLDQITPVVLTYDEEPNLERTLSALRWAREVVVVDSFSQDRTLEIARSFPNVRLVQRRFDTFVAQWSHGLEQVASPWVLALDADYQLTAELQRELAALEPEDDVAGYRAPFRYCIDGVALRGSLYPPGVVLFRRGRARYVQDGHTQRLQVQSGRVVSLQHSLLHDDRKPHARWLRSQRRYAIDEADKLARTPLRELSWPDRVRTLPFAAVPLVALHALFVKGVVRDGRRGLEYVRQRATAEALISLAVLRRRLRAPG